jgi:hypothetical protein
LPFSGFSNKPQVVKFYDWQQAKDKIGLNKKFREMANNFFSAHYLKKKT